MVERNMCDAVMRGIVVPPGSRATSRAQGSVGTWDIPRLTTGHVPTGPHREGEEP
jgi:hypothetical protein